MGGLAITNATIINPFWIVKNATIIVENDKIIEIGPLGKKDIQRYDIEEIIDARNMLVLPGLINCHTHLYQSLFRGSVDEESLRETLNKVIFPIEKDMPFEAMYYSALLGCVESIKNGTTCLVDLHCNRNFEAIVKAVDKIGIRAFLAPSIYDEYQIITSDEAIDSLERTIAIIKTLQKAYPSINFMLGFPGYDETLESIAKYLLAHVKALKLMLHTHASEELALVNSFKTKKGMGQVACMHSAGLLTPRTLLAHCIWIDENELRALKHTKAKVVHCPVSNAKLRDGTLPLERFKKLQIPICLGTDGAITNDSMDLFQEMKYAILLQRTRNLLISSAEVFRMCTYNASNALGAGSLIGSIEVGKKADIIIAQPSYGIGENYNFIYYLTGKDVETVIINGRLIMKDRKLLTIDEKEIIKKARIWLSRFKNSLNLYHSIL
jgi:cytosine/adenosine deaminase-related metal-dependent hydrolase